MLGNHSLGKDLWKLRLQWHLGSSLTRVFQICRMCRLLGAEMILWLMMGKKELTGTVKLFKYVSKTSGLTQMLQFKVMNSACNNNQILTKMPLGISYRQNFKISSCNLSRKIYIKKVISQASKSIASSTNNRSLISLILVSPRYNRGSRILNPLNF